MSDEVLKCLLPGPVTLVFQRTQTLNKNFNPDTNLIGVRIPDNNFIRGVCCYCSSAVALTSANYRHVIQISLLHTNGENIIVITKIIMVPSNHSNF